MNKKVLGGILITGIILLCGANIFAQEGPPETVKPPMGLRVEPGGMMVQYVPLGITYDFYESVGIPLVIYNRDASPHTYILSADKPSTVAARKWLKGYSEIPDPSWMWFEKDEVTIEAQGKTEVKMYLKIPDEEKYYNQHWSVALGVKGKAEPGQMLALAAYPRVQIETLSKEDVNERPDGAIGFVPSTLLVEDLVLGKKEELKLKIYNNDTNCHIYKIRSEVFPKDPTKELIHTSPTYSWIPEPNWVKPDTRRVTIDGQESLELTVRVEVPKDKENYKRSWESILFIEPDKGLPGFVRVQIKTERAAE